MRDEGGGADLGGKVAVRPADDGAQQDTPATLSRWVSSINQFHTAASLDAPGRSEVVRRALSGIRRIRRVPPNQREPLLLSDIRTPLTSLSA